jgi:hypothetical protein
VIKEIPKYTPTVNPQTRELNFVSPSGMEKFDDESAGGCLRKGFFRYVLKKPEKETKSKDLGIEQHGKLEHFYKTGENVLNPMILVGWRDLPSREGVVGVEDSLVLGAVPLEGVPLIGKIDLRWRSPEGVPWAWDWKFRKDFRFLSQPQDMLKSIQMLAYGVHELALDQGASQVGLAHGNFRTTGAAKHEFVTLTRPRAEIEQRWNDRAIPLIRKIKLAVRAERVEDLEPNLRACESFGGCSYNWVCPRSPVKVSAEMSSLLASIRAKSQAALANGVPSNAPAQVPTGILPPDAPGPNPALDAKPIPPGTPPAVLGPAAAQIMAKQPTSALEAAQMGYTGTPPLARTDGTLVNTDGTPFVMPTSGPVVMTDAQAALPTPTAPVTALKEPKKRGPKPKAAAPEQANPGHGVPITQGAPEGATLYVDCLPEGSTTTDIGPLVDQCVRQVAETFGLQDVRLAPDASPIAFGRWKAAVSECAKETIGDPVGDCSILVRGDELRGASITGLAAKFARVVRGVR